MYFLIKTNEKIVAAIGVIILIVVGKVAGGYFFGVAGSVVGALIGAALGGYALKQSGVISPNSSLVSETQGVRTAKYVLLAVVLIALGAVAYMALAQ